jgi:hypothetical protein
MYNKEESVLVLDLKGDGEVEKWTNPLYLEGLLKEFMDKEQHILDNTHTFCNNFNDKTFLVKEASLLENIHK